MRKMEKLEKLVNVLSGYPFESTFFNEIEGIPLIRIRDVQRGFTNTFYTGIFDEKYLVKKGDILIGMDGEFNLARWNSEDALLNQRVCKIKSKDESFLIESYLQYFLPQKIKEIEQRTSFVTVKHLSVKDIVNIEIPLPSLKTQKHIASILQKADSLRKKDLQLLQHYDDLAQSLFIDMFGDPVKNEKGWQLRTIKEIVKAEKYSIKAGPFGSALKKEFYVKAGFKIYGQEQVIRDNFSYGDYYIDEKRYHQLKSNSIAKGDILISLVGSYGKISIVPDDFEPGIINPRLMKISLDPSKANNVFFKCLLQMEQMKSKINNISRGGTMDIINVGIMSDLQIIVPSIHLQNQFAQQIQSIEQQKEKVKVQMQESENLFQALLQKAFSQGM